LEDIRRGRISVRDGLERLKHMPFADIGFARIDTHRGVRCGFPEVVLCEGKTREQVIKIVDKLVESGSDVLATRADGAVAAAIVEKYPRAEYNETARTVLIRRRKSRGRGNVLIITGGTSDIPVAEEAKVTAEAMGSKVETLYDVGVAGIHRLLSSKEKLSRANVIVVVAGMEGALASVVGGLVSKPVIAVPTSVGYGASFGGIAALLTMLNSCAAGVAVVNIDNGFGAGYMASLINLRL